jgi:hypothetical protein
VIKHLLSKYKALNSNTDSIKKKKQQKKSLKCVKSWRLVLVILATSEAEIRKIITQGQCKQNSSGDPIFKLKKQNGLE